MRIRLWLSRAAGATFGIAALTNLQAIAQLPVINSFSQNRVLVCTNLSPGSVASVQWASSLSSTTFSGSIL
jgi:hypothetical protein